MKRPRHGLQSTRPKQKNGTIILPVPVPQLAPPVLPLFTPDVIPAYPGPAHGVQPSPIVIADDGDESIANIFCFRAFADKNSGIVYHDLTGLFPFMSFNGSICFFVLYHYESNAILATPITGLDDVSIFNNYKKYFVDLTAKGFKPKLNVMDNQATRHIKKILTKNDCTLQIVEPHNHRVNAAEWAIQTFKGVFIAALATTDSESPLQLWDRLTPQVEDTLNMLRASPVNPSKSVYEILNGPYDWNRYPPAPLGCKAVVYEDGKTRGSWASCGINAFYLGPATDHYRCNNYYIPNTLPYRVSGSTNLFPQHCQLPSMTPHQHFCALTNELTEHTAQANSTPKGWRLLKLLGTRIESLLHPPPILEAQRVIAERQHKAHEAEQRVIDDSPIITIP
jgi:hypothetical protein